MSEELKYYFELLGVNTNLDAIREIRRLKDLDRVVKEAKKDFDEIYSGRKWNSIGSTV
jgi:hypothetical protein